MGCHQGRPPRKVILSVDFGQEKMKGYYALGVQLAEHSKKYIPNQKEKLAIMLGFYNASNNYNHPKDFKLNEGHKLLSTILDEKQTEMSNKNHSRGLKFMEDFLINHQGKKTISGLGYRIIKEGKGSNPSNNDIIEVLYTGLTLDNVKIDEWYSKNDGPKKVSTLIKGIQEGIKLIKPGGYIQLVIPPNLAFGDKGIPPKIWGKETLRYYVHLLGIQESDI